MLDQMLFLITLLDITGLRGHTWSYPKLSLRVVEPYYLEGGIGTGSSSVNGTGFIVSGTLGHCILPFL
jgi:hypothetical protein